jgi:hypothetical protein
MNTHERRQLVRAQVIDSAVAKAAIKKSQRVRAKATKDLRKTLAQAQYDARHVDSISYPQTKLSSSFL